ncbi:homeobox protein 2-like [Nasonia vitripennis]|uniref:Chitin-binding type-2 domain-containing protein n=1 Tax=Nasonia vitripennis TaxID=7425 RepID=A0A7M7HC29_NASVI|nr:homeobox protein 2-like [Nasonia vitripennis]
MASEVISVLIASVIVCVFAEPPVQIDERHLQPNHDQDDNAGNGWQDSVPGLPGRDYPNLTSIPETSFTCAGKTPGGYYADVETRCQVFHVCSTNGAKSSFLCPSGSVFNQRHFVCDWWYDFICEQAPKLYALNRGLDDRLETPSSTPSLPIDSSFNSIAGPGGDLSLASSGYPNNIRDDANSIYEDYTSVKIADSEPAKEKFPSVAASSAPSASVQQLGDSSQATTSGIPADNYFEARRHERLNSQQQHQTRGRNHEENRRPLTYRRRPIHGLDNVPRGFSKDHAEKQALAKGSNQGAGSFVNNGLADESERNKNFPLPRENNNYVDSNTYNNRLNAADNDNQNRNINDFNGNNNNNRFENYYQSTERYPLVPQNSNRVNKNYTANNNNNNNNNNNANNNYYNGNNVNNDVQSNNYYNQNNFNDNDQNSNNNYYNKNNMNSNEYYNPGNNNIKYDNYNRKAESVESSTVHSYSTNYDFPKDHQAQTSELSTSRPRSINSSPTEDDVDRERQREVDSADLKRKRPQPHHQQSYDNQSPAFLIREEFTPNIWRDDLSTSSTASQSPPYPPDRGYLSPGSDTSTLSRPVEVTTPVASTTVSYPKPKPQERPKFLGRRPAGGLPSGAGNGLPGANKVLIGSDAITNTPGEESAGAGDNSESGVTASGVNGNGNGVNGWGDQSSTYLPPQTYNEFGGDGQNNNWNNAGQTWNNGRHYDGRY